jgi:translation initiation factor eIF-2B subunit alpha
LVNSIVSAYLNILHEDPEITMPIAAIEALVHLLSQSSSSTISETLDLLETSTQHLKESIPNPIALSAGTDLFQRYLISSLQRPGQLGPAGDFNAIRAHLLANGRLFVKRAKESRDKIAAYGKGFVRDGTTVLTNGGSRVVGALLQKAADDKNSSGPAIRFRVLYVISNSTRSGSEQEGLATVKALRAKGVPVATIPESAVAYSMRKADMVIVGAEGVVENGGMISRMGTYQIAILAKAMSKPFYVVAESHKFVRLYPLDQYDLPIEQEVIDFKTEDDKPSKKNFRRGDETKRQSWGNPKTPTIQEREDYFGSPKGKAIDAAGVVAQASEGDAVDFTPPDLISALITESGVLTPSAVSEELIKIWF